MYVPRILLYILISHSLYALRDPFQAATWQQRYCYTSWGEVQGQLFALCSIDGVWYQLKKGSFLVQHEVKYLSKKKLILLDERGVERTIHLKKGPST